MRSRAEVGALMLIIKNGRIVHRISTRKHSKRTVASTIAAPQQSALPVTNADQNVISCRQSSYQFQDICTTRDERYRERVKQLKLLLYGPILASKVFSWSLVYNDVSKFRRLFLDDPRSSLSKISRSCRGGVLTDALCARRKLSRLWRESRKQSPLRWLQR